MNKTILSGRLTADPELKYTPNGVPVANFTLAVARRFKREGQPEADFINCTIWQKIAETTANMVGKGCRVAVVGRWETRNYEGQDGKKVYVNECIVDEIDFIDFADREGRNNTPNNQSNTNTSGSQEKPPVSQNKGYTRMDEDPFAGKGQIDISDDDLPF